MKQQQSDVMLSSLKGPRQFYRHMRGDRGILLYDLVTWSGFALRALLFGLAGGLAALGGGGQRWRAKARSSADLAGRAWRVLRSA